MPNPAVVSFRRVREREGAGRVRRGGTGLPPVSLAGGRVGLFNRVMEAADGSQALDRLRTAQPPDIALVDWNMPVINGLEFVTALRSEPSLGPFPVLMVATETEIPNIPAALRASASAVASSPRVFCPAMCAPFSVGRTP